MMVDLVQVPQTQVIMAFVATCIEATARTLGTDYNTVFDRMEKVNMIDEYIYPCYETLHTESRENLVDDLIKCLNNWEAKA
jgi:glutathione peroxidase-family protein